MAGKTAKRIHGHLRPSDHPRSTAKPARHRSRGVITATLVAALGSLVGIAAPLPAGAQEPKPITRCNQFIRQPGDYVVVNDLLDCPHFGIAISSSAEDVTIDLNGKTISGDISGDGTAFGIVNLLRRGPARDVEIIGNGATLTGFTWGIEAHARTMVVTGVTVRDAAGVRGDNRGIHVSGRDVTVTGNTIIGDQDSEGIIVGGDPGFGNGSHDVTVEENTIVGAAVGIRVSKGAHGLVEITGNTFGDGTVAPSPLDNTCDLSVERSFQGRSSDLVLSENEPGDSSPALSTCGRYADA